MLCNSFALPSTNSQVTTTSAVHCGYKPIEYEYGEARCDSYSRSILSLIEQIPA
jgi:hypothetical protein